MDAQLIKNFFSYVVANFPHGTIKSGCPVTIGESSLRAVIFPQDNSSEREVSFGLFLGEQRYSRKTFIIRPDGVIEEDTVGIIPDFDLTDREPDFSDISNDEIVELVIKTVNELGHTNYAKKV